MVLALGAVACGDDSGGLAGSGGNIAAAGSGAGGGQAGFAGAAGAGGSATGGAGGSGGTSGAAGSAGSGGGSAGAAGGTGLNAFRAFPEAEGYGALALTKCDRSNVQVLKVTSLSSSGSGTLADAIAKADPARLTIVTFAVAGTIKSSVKVKANQGCLYIAGQTAPGGGVQLHAGGAAFLVDRTGPKDVAVRYLRFRSSKGVGGTSDVVNIYGGERIIFDHTSAQFGNDEVFTIRTVEASNASNIKQVTLQHSIIAAGLVPHSTGSLLGGTENYDLSELSVHHNLWAEQSHRNPLVGGASERVQVINNVTYNYKGQPAETTEQMPSVDFVGNYWKTGPWSRKDKPVLHHLQGASLRSNVLFASGNVHTHLMPKGTGDQHSLFRYDGTKTDGAPDYGQLPASVFRNSPSASPTVAVNVQSASDAYQTVLAEAGASARVSCAGDWVANRDVLDALIIERTTKGTGSGADTDHDDPSDFGGVPSLAKGSPCADQDGDGMPDEFETRYGLDPANATDASSDDDGDGYTNIEEYVNGTVPTLK